MEKFADQQLELRFFDIQANIRSDMPRFIDIFKKMYCRFQSDSLSSSLQPPIDFIIKTQLENPRDKPSLTIDGEELQLKNSALLEGYVYENILHTILSKVRSHFLIHAGVVSLNGQGLVLTGKGGHGKTTLVLELIRRGFRFLSDEMAALGRQDNHVHPFPRSLRIRPGTLELTDFATAAERATKWLDKIIIDIEKIQPACLGKSVPPTHIVILSNPIENEQNETECSVQGLIILVNRLDHVMIKAIRRIEGVTDVQFSDDGLLPFLRIFSIRRTLVLSKIEEICRQQQIRILNIIKDHFSLPSFDGTPRLKTIAKSRAVMELLRNFQGGHKSALLREACGGRTTQLFMELSTIINNANCYQLFVGSLGEMADLICSLFDQERIGNGR